MNNIDNRDYFRLSDKVDAQYMLISPDQVASGTTEQHFSDAAELCVFKKLYALDMENQEILRELDSQNHCTTTLIFIKIRSYGPLGCHIKENQS